MIPSFFQDKCCGEKPDPKLDSNWSYRTNNNSTTTHWVAEIHICSARCWYSCFVLVSRPNIPTNLQGTNIKEFEKFPKGTSAACTANRLQAGAVAPAADVATLSMCAHSNRSPLSYHGKVNEDRNSPVTNAMITKVTEGVLKTVNTSCSETQWKMTALCCPNGEIFLFLQTFAAQTELGVNLQSR